MSNESLTEGAAGGAARMRAWALELPDQIARALELAGQQGWPPPGPPPRAVFLGGMGGSSMACALARSILADRLPIPCEVHQDPRLPAWVAAETLAVVASYSGETWEARQMLAGCLERGARTCLVASGGRAVEAPGLARESAFLIPPGYAPRSALGWMLVPVLLAVGAAGGVSVRAELEEAVRSLREEMEAWSAGGSFPGRDPRALAAHLRERPAVIYAPDELFRPLAVRWKNQLLENAKQAAAEAAFPELAHNEIMGWEFAAARRTAFVVVEDEDPQEEAGAKRARRGALEAALRELTRTGASFLRVPSRGTGLASRMLGHVALADLASLELAALLGIDPLPIPAIQRVRSDIGSEGGKERFG